MPERAPNAELLSALGRLVRGLSALFWGLPISLVVCVQTAKGDWLQPLGILPPLLAAGLLWYGVTLLRAFQRQERIWQTSLERARLLALVNLGLAPFLYWWNRVPSHPFYMAMVEVLILSGLFFLYCLNPMLWRLAAMLPDETLRLETRTFTVVNRYLLLVALGLLSFYFLAARLQPLLGKAKALDLVEEAAGLVRRDVEGSGAGDGFVRAVLDPIEGQRIFADAHVDGRRHRLEIP